MSSESVRWGDASVAFLRCAPLPLPNPNNRTIRKSHRATCSSSGPTPALASSTSATASLSFTATAACSLISGCIRRFAALAADRCRHCCWAPSSSSSSSPPPSSTPSPFPSSSSSSPPVSTTRTSSPPKLHRPSFRSRVVPGTSVTIAAPPGDPLPPPVKRLNSVDLPTFGLPTSARRKGDRCVGVCRGGGCGGCSPGSLVPVPGLVLLLTGACRVATRSRRCRIRQEECGGAGGGGNSRQHRSASAILSLSIDLTHTKQGRAAASNSS